MVFWNRCPSPNFELAILSKEELLGLQLQTNMYLYIFIYVFIYIYIFICMGQVLSLNLRLVIETNKEKLIGPELREHSLRTDLEHV